MKRAGRDEWAKRVRRWRNGGLSAEAFAAMEQLNPSTLQWWSSRLRRLERTERRPAFVELVVPETVAMRARPARQAAIELLIRDDVRLAVPVGFDEATLRRLLAVVEAG